MTYPPPPGPDGVYPPPPDPPIQAYQPPPVQPRSQQHVYDYGNPGSPYSQPAYPYAPVRPTEGLAIASLAVSCAAVLGLCAWTVGGVLGLVGAILGHVARRRIRQTGANGAGMALAGIIVGWVCTGIAVLGAAALIALVIADPSTS
jgi:hypothetical protein